MVMTDLNKILTVPATILEDSQSEGSEIEPTKITYEVEVQAGKRVVDFVEELKKQKMALEMMGNYAGQTVGGVASTSTHGSGLFSGTMVRLVEWSNKNIIS